ncbi:MAG: hypothetical protein MUO89_00935, partial [Dehalococcoidia bacterium]|nr:hypothetical protein [Dehalococcoidia bacterium]
MVGKAEAIYSRLFCRFFTLTPSLSHQGRGGYWQFGRGFKLDKAQATGYKIYTMKFFGYACLILLLALTLVPG